MLRLRARSSLARVTPLICLWLVTVEPVFAEPGEPPQAQSLARVVLVTDNQNSEVALLLAAELTALGFSVDTQKLDAEHVAPRELNQLARQADAVAAFRVSVTAERVEVWIADRVTGKVTLREVIRPSPGEPLAARTIVLRAVELLRWSLTELKAPYPSRGEIEVPPEPVTELAKSARPERVFGLGAAAYVGHLSGGSGSAVGIAFGASLSLGHFGGRLELGQPLGEQLLSGAQGDVEISTRWVGAEFIWTMSDWAWLEPSLGFGCKLVGLELTGVVEAPLVPKTTRDYSLAPSLRSRLAFKWVDYFQLFLEGSSAWLPNETQVALAGEPLGNLGPWLLTGGAGIELTIR